MLRVYIDMPLAAGAELALPPDAARHVQVLRLQPGNPLALFNGQGGEWHAEVTEMGRRHVNVRVLTHQAVDRELPSQICLAVGAPANERFDWLIEKACELGAHTIQPLLCERSVLRVQGERAERKQAHWQSVAIAAAEQCGRTRPLNVRAPLTLPAWLTALSAADTPARRWVLSLHPHAKPVAAHTTAVGTPITLLSGPEGGLSPAEEQLALTHGFEPVTLGQRVLRAETAPLACLAWLGLHDPRR